MNNDMEADLGDKIGMNADVLIMPGFDQSINQNARPAMPMARPT